MLLIGLMSGTSADGVDAALVEWPDAGPPHPFRLLAFCEQPFSPALQSRIHRLAAGEVPGVDALAEYARLDALLAERFAEAAREVAQTAGLALAEVRAVASHGQTVAHHPEFGSSLQIGDPSIIAERTGCTVVADFRARDLAAGGEGAPLAPFFHFVALAHADENRVALNLGGIANLTWLPRGGRAEDVTAFDVGPANALLDEVVRITTRGAERFDRDGRRAGRGRTDAALLARLLDDDFLRRAPPKSTGRERYGRAAAVSLVSDWQQQDRAADDLLATLVDFTAESVARACRDFLPASGSARALADRILVGGGGAENPTLLGALRRRLPGIAVERFDSVGVPAQAVEAMAFSLLGRNAILGLPNHLPRCTGAQRACVLGEIVPGRPAAQQPVENPG